MLRAALVLLLLLPLADAATVRVELEAVDSAYRLAGDDAPNPTLRALPGDRVEVHLVNRGALEHNVAFGAPVGQAMPCCLQPGEDATIAFDLPPGFEGNVTYACTLHGASGMRDLLVVAPPQPDVRILTPANNTTAHERLVVRVRSANASGPTSYRVLLDGVARANGTDETFDLGAPAGGHHLVAVELLDLGANVLARDESLVFFDPSPAPVTPEAPTPEPTSSATPEKPTPLAPILVAGALALAAAFRRSRRA